jgi:hypothetical protein
MAGNLDQRRTNAQVVCGTGFSANKRGASFHELALIVRTETKHTHYEIRIISGDKCRWVMRQ